MHESVLAMLRRSPGATLASISARTRMVAAFSKDRSAPLWVAKVASDASMAADLRREHRALAYLAPWAEQLGIPKLLLFEDRPSCTSLIVTGLEGVSRRLSLQASRSPARLEPYFEAALDWLDRFVSLVPLPERIPVCELLPPLRRQLALRAGIGPSLQGMLALLEESSHTLSQVNAIPVHGDYFPLNIMFGASRLGVVDWAGFGPGSPLQDFFAFATGIDYYFGNRMGNPVEAHLAALFSDLPICHYVRGHIQKRAPDAELARLFFYCHVAAQIAADQYYPDATWAGLLNVLDAAGFPGPSTRVLR